MEIVFKSIGTIESPFHKKKGMPIQPSGAKGIKGRIVLDKKYKPAIKDLEGFSHLILLYYFHQSKSYQSKVTPFLDDRPHGVLATRAPSRPNPIGLSVVKLLKVQENILEVENLDILNATPLLDIKPYVPEFDAIKTSQVGWLTHKQVNAQKQISDNRF